MTTGWRPPGDKETWWWNDKVQEVIKAKKVAKKIWDASRRQGDKDRYRQANKAAKKAVATTSVLPRFSKGQGHPCHLKRAHLVR